MMHRVRHRRSAALAGTMLAVVAWGTPALAQDATPVAPTDAPAANAPTPLVTMPTAVGVVRRAATDAAPPRGVAFREADGWKVGGLLVAAMLVATADRRGDAWARRTGVRDDATLRSLSRVGAVSGSWLALGAGPAAWLLGRARGDSAVQVMGLRTTEAVVLSGAVISALKVVTGRSRPYASRDGSPAHWSAFGGWRSDSTRSFASGHAGFAAAAAVTLAAEWRRQGRSGWNTLGPPLVYSLAAITAGSRVRDRQHWLSDVLMGAAVGTASALVVRRWHDAHPANRLDRLLVTH